MQNLKVENCYSLDKTEDLNLGHRISDHSETASKEVGEEAGYTEIFATKIR